MKSDSPLCPDPPCSWLVVGGKQLLPSTEEAPSLADGRLQGAAGCYLILRTTDFSLPTFESPPRSRVFSLDFSLTAA